ncbi:MAG: hypothetical protein K8E24_012450 [Methanobacterium paludis]|nr:hypothetical protein [Methanobacterium paludis]
MKINGYNIKYGTTDLEDDYTPDVDVSLAPYGDRIIRDEETIDHVQSWSIVLFDDEIEDVTGMFEQSRIAHIDDDMGFKGFIFITSWKINWIKFLDNRKIASYDIDSYPLDKIPYLNMTYFSNYQDTDWDLIGPSIVTLIVDNLSKLSVEPDYYRDGFNNIGCFNDPDSRIYFKAEPNMIIDSMKLYDGPKRLYKDTKDYVTNNVYLTNGFLKVKILFNDVDNSLALYNSDGDEYLRIGDGVNNVTSNDVQINLNPYETKITINHTNYFIRHGSDFVELSNSPSVIEYPNKELVICTNADMNYGDRRSTTENPASFILDTQIGSNVPTQLIYENDPGFIHYTPSENHSFISVCTTKSTHPNDGFNEKTERNYICVSNDHPTLIGVGDMTELPTNTYNLLTLIQSYGGEGGSTTGVTSTGSATITPSTDYAYAGSYSFKVVTTGSNAGQGIKIGSSLTYFIPTVIGKTYNASMYVRGNGVLAYAFQEVDSSGNKLSAVTGETVTLSSTKWTRIDLTRTITSSNYAVLELSTISGQRVTFYADCLMVTQGSGLYPWVIGQSNGSAGLWTLMNDGQARNGRAQYKLSSQPGSRLHADLNVYTNLLKQNLQTGGDLTSNHATLNQSNGGEDGTVTGFEAAGNQTYINLLPLNVANGGEDGTVAGFVGGFNGGSITNNTNWSAMGTHSILVKSSGSTAREGVRSTTVMAVSASTQYGMQLKIKGTSGVVIDLYVYDQDWTNGILVKTFTLTGNVDTISGTFTTSAAATGMMWGVYTHSTISTSFNIDMLMVNQGAKAYPFVLPGTTGNTVSVENMGEKANAVKLMYLGDNSATASTMQTLADLGVTDVVKWFGSLENANYNTFKTNTELYLGMVEGTGLRLHACFAPFQKTDNTFIDPSSADFARFKSEVITNAQKICSETSIVGLSADDFIYPTAYYSSANDSTQSALLVEYATELNSAIHAGNENTIFSMATFDGYSAYASKLAPFVDWYMPEIYRYTKYDRSCFESLILLFICLCTSTPIQFLCIY